MGNAGAALRIARDAYGLHFAAPNVAGNQPTVQRFRLARKNFQCLGYFERCDQAHDWAKHTDGVASLLQQRSCIGSFQQARQARRGSRANGVRQTVAADRGCVNPGSASLNSKIIEQKARFEIVSAVQQQLESLQQFLYVSRNQISDYPFNFYLRIQQLQLAFRGHGLCQGFTGIVFIKKSLPLQVRRLDKISVNDPQPSDSSTGKQLRGRSSDCAATHNDGTRAQKFSLPLFTHVGEENLARVSFKNGVYRQEK